MNVWPAAWRWRTNQRLEEKRRDWLATVLLDYVATLPEMRERAELEPPSSLLSRAPLDDEHSIALSDVGSDWLAVKICARRLPTDPVEAGEEVVVKALERRGADLARQAESFKPRADDRAPDGGRWFPWAMEHPESEITPEEAAAWDLQSGEFEGWEKLSTSFGINHVRRQLRRSRWVSDVVRVAPLTLLALALALAEAFMPRVAWWWVVLVSLVSFILIDLLLIEHVVEPILNNRRRRILDRLADAFGRGIGVSALAAAKGRERGKLRTQPKPSETEE